jgi:hypothetical protein
LKTTAPAARHRSSRLCVEGFASAATVVAGSLLLVSFADDVDFTGFGGRSAFDLRVRE